MKEYNYKEICEMLVGSAFLAGGGGGSLKAGIKLFDNLRDETLKMYELEDLVDTPETKAEYTAILSALGNPSKIDDSNFAAMLRSAIQQMRKRCTACTPYKEITHIIPRGLGGMKTAIPAYISMLDKEFSLADADGSGRSVPALETTLVSLNEASITPFVMSNENSDCMCIDLSDDKDAVKCEEVSQSLTQTPLYGKVSGVAAYPIKSSDLATIANPHSLSYAQLLGSKISAYAEQKGDKEQSCVFDYLNENVENFSSVVLGKNDDDWTTILSKAGKRQLSNGSTFGFIEIASKGVGQINRWEIHFLDESIIVYQNGSTTLNAPVLTAPDIICIFDETENIPLSNKYILENIDSLRNHKVSLGVFSAPQSWWDKYDTKQMTAIWRKFYDELDYHGNCLPFSNVKNRL